MIDPREVSQVWSGKAIRHRAFASPNWQRQRAIRFTSRHGNRWHGTCEPSQRPSDVQKAIANNPRGAAKTRFQEVFEEELMKMFIERASFYTMLDGDPSLKESISEKVSEELYAHKL